MAFQEVKSRATTKRQNQLASALGDLVSETAPVPEVMDGTVNLRQLTRDQRNGLLQGAVVTVTHGGAPIAKVHKRVFMAASEWGNAQIREYPTAKDLALPASASRLDVSALKTVLGWMSTRFLGGDKIRVIPMGDNTIEACKVYHAATILGMRPYVAHIAAFLHTYISDRTCLLGYSELSALLAAVDTEDALFKHLARDLAHRRYTNQIPDMDVFVGWLKKNLVLSRAMDQIDKDHAAERKARKKEHYKSLARAHNAVEQDEERRRVAKEEFEARLREARGGRSGGFGMGI